MKERLKKFVDILRIELEDLEEDINTLAEITEARCKEHAITEYVCMENVGLLRQEFAGIREVLDDLQTVEIGKDETFQDFVDHLKERFRRVIHNSAYPDAVYIFVERKVQKVADYITGNVV